MLLSPAPHCFPHFTDFCCWVCDYCKDTHYCGCTEANKTWLRTFLIPPQMHNWGCILAERKSGSIKSDAFHMGLKGTAPKPGGSAQKDGTALMALSGTGRNGALMAPAAAFWAFHSLPKYLKLNLFGFHSFLQSMSPTDSSEHQSLAYQFLWI